MHYLSSVYFVNQTLHVSGIYVAHHQDVQPYLYNNMYLLFLFRWLSVVLVGLDMPETCTGWRNIYTGCHRRNEPNFGRVFLMLNYTDITQNTYIQSWTVTEIMAREKCGHLAFPRTVRLQLCSALTVREECGTHFCDGTSSAQRDKIAFHYCRYVQCLVTLRTTVTVVRVFL